MVDINAKNAAADANNPGMMQPGVQMMPGQLLAPPVMAPN